MNKTYGLIGSPLSHSFSKKYFNEKFVKENINDSQYDLYPIEDINQLPQLISNNPGLCGLNVTIPYKESVIPYLDELDETAKAVGAVNCIKIVSGIEYQVSSNQPDSNQQTTNKKQLVGYNTDIYGFRQSIKPFLETQHERALILGTGGASKAVAYVLKEIGIECFFVSRSKEQNSRIKNQDSGARIFLYEELTDYIISAFKLIVNTTPVGMYPDINVAPKIPYQSLLPSHLLYDLVYNPTETEFLKRGKLQGASTVNGLSMLHQQAEEAWRIWNK